MAHSQVQQSQINSEVNCGTTTGNRFGTVASLDGGQTSPNGLPDRIARKGLTTDPTGVSIYIFPSASYEHREEILPGAREIEGTNERPTTGIPICRLPLVYEGRRPHTAPYSSNATRTNWLRVRTPVFTKSCWRADFTEASEIFRCAAISLLLEPANTPLSTFRSRSLN